jgi:replicative DNA helicase
MGDRHPESLLISALLNTGDVLQAEELGVTTGHVHEYKAEYEWLVDYKIKYRHEPSSTAFKSVFPKFEISEHSDVEYAVDQVKRNHLKWATARLIREATSKLKEDEPEDALDLLMQTTMKIGQGIDAANNIEDSIKSPTDSFEFALFRSESEVAVGAVFAHPTVQERTLGMQGGDLWLKAARLGQGKTWDLLNDTCANLILGKNVTIFSLEMNRRQIEYRVQTILGAMLGYTITNDQLAKGRNLDLIEYKAMLNDIAERVPGRLQICDRRRGKVTARTVASLVNKYEPDLAVIDYIGLMSSTSKNNYSQSWENVAQVVEEVKEVACQFDVPILSAAQINREGERGSWRPPKAVHLAGSDSLGRDADCVITMKRFGMGAMVYSLEKNRHGASGDVWFSKFYPNVGDFAEISREQAERIKEQEGEFEDE